MDKYITFDISLLILQDPNVHPLLQSAYLDFIISAFVDVIVENSGVDIDNYRHFYVSNITKNMPSTNTYNSQEWDNLSPRSIEAANFSIISDQDRTNFKKLIKCITVKLQEKVVRFAFMHL